MKLTLPCLVFCALFLLSWGVSAQDAGKDTVDLAMIASINVTLDANCQATIIPSEILTGDFDVDGDGNVPPDDAFIIEVLEDGNPANLDTIDGCGSFTVRVTVDTSLIAGFTTGWANVNAEDKIAPEFFATPTPPVGPLYCSDVEDISLDMLPTSVSRCYTFDQETNSIVASSLDPALSERLIAGGGFPSVTDNCSRFIEVCVFDIVTRDPVNPACNDVTITRTFTATDGSCPSLPASEPTEAAVADYSITFVRPTLDSLNASNVPSLVEIDCDELSDLGLTFGDLPAPRTIDLPFLPGPGGTSIPLELGDDGSFCGLGVTFSDSPIITTCDDAYKVIRTYTLIDWCNPGDVRELQQIVKIGDFSAPVFTAPAGERVFGTNGIQECGALLFLDGPELSISDACSESFTITAYIFLDRDLSSNPLGGYPIVLNDGDPTFSDLVPLGAHTLQYVYEDNCGNADTTNLPIVVEDGTKPVAICEDGLNVSITSAVGAGGVLGSAVLTPEMIDNGSYDDCSNISLAIAQVEEQPDGSFTLLGDATYGPTLLLDCEDLGTVTVGLRVRDESDQDNFCWLDVLVEDKASPVCTAPADLILTCDEFAAANFPADIMEATDAEIDAFFGAAFAVDNCEVELQQTISGDVDNCGLGRFDRTFTTVNGESFLGNQICTQSVQIVGLHEYTIEFPGDAITFCGFDPNAGSLGITEGTCDLITSQVSRDTFTSDSDGCFKVRVEYLVVNWCEYSSIGDPFVLPRDFDGDNNLRESVFLHVVPNDDKTLLDDEAFLDGDSNPNNDSFTLDVAADGNITDYGTSNSRGAFIYYQYLKVQDQVAPEIVADNQNDCFAALTTNCTGDVSFQFEISDNCTPLRQLNSLVELDLDFNDIAFDRDRFVLDSELSSDDEGNFTLTLTNVPTGEHAVLVRAFDGCGNENNRVITFCVTDQLAPAPICLNQATVGLTPNGNGTGQAAFWATDGIASDVDDCSGEVTYSVYKTFETLNDDFVPSPNRDGIIFSCDDDQTTPIRIYAFDPAGQSSFCDMLILVQRADNACVSTANRVNIGGAISTFSGDPVRGVDVTLTGGDVAVNIQALGDGTYLFENIQPGNDYTVTPVFDNYINHSQGVSTFDLVLITRYILGLEDLRTPYQFIAADTNGDEEISVTDIIAARRLILGLDQAYQNGPGWRFVDENFVFPVTGNPWATAYPEVQNYNNLNVSVRNGDFVAVMVGDVSGNRPGFTGNGGTVPRSNAQRLSVADQRLAAGELHTLAVTTGSIGDLSGLQGTLQIGADLEVTDVVPGQIGRGEMNLDYLERGLLSFSLANTTDLATDEVLFSLTVRSNEATSLGESLSLSDELLRTEGYLGTTALTGLSLDFGQGAIADADYQLEQNVPNPAAAFTAVRFNLPVAGEAAITVRDLTGRVVLQQEQAAVAGWNQVELDLRAITAAGVYTYTLTAGDFTATRKLIKQ